MKQVLFILPALPEFEPYAFNYFAIAERMAVDFDVICWNRKGDCFDAPDNYFVYQIATNDNFSPLKKMMEIYGFYNFAKKVMRNRKYHAVFVFTIADAVFFASYLRKYYKGRYVFDIRDYSPMVTWPFFVDKLKCLLRNSAFNVISSEGYKSWLPKGFDYIVCHNVDLDKLRGAMDYKAIAKTDCTMTVLTIGSIRDVSSNAQVIDALANQPDFQISFVGAGNGVPALKQHCVAHNVRNVFFYGRYKKEDEDGFVEGCDLMSIYLPQNIGSSSLMTNRFYLATRFRKPIIANKGSFGADQVEKYGLGLVVSEASHLADDIRDYMKSLNREMFDSNCLRFLKDVDKDMIRFEETITKALT